MKPLLFRTLAGTLGLVDLIYCGDYLAVRYRLPHGREVFQTVSVTPMYVIHEKNRKTEYQLGQPQNELCVLSVFPHFGYQPCWYLHRHTDKRIEI